MDSAPTRGGGAAQAVYAWVLAHTLHRGWLAAGLCFFIAVSVANGARGDWLSVLLGLAISVVCAMRLRATRDHAAPDLP